MKRFESYSFRESIFKPRFFLPLGETGVLFEIKHQILAPKQKKFLPREKTFFIIRHRCVSCQRTRMSGGTVLQIGE
jgi:hypothetical protein